MTSGKNITLVIVAVLLSLAMWMAPENLSV